MHLPLLMLLPLADPTALGSTPSWSPPTEAERAMAALKHVATGAVRATLTRPSAGEPAMGAFGDIASLPKSMPQAHWLPLEIADDGAIVTTVFVNLKPVRARLDTGSNVNIIRENVAEQVGLMSPFVVRRPSQLKVHGTNHDVLNAYADMVDVGPVRIKRTGFAIPRGDANAELFPSFAYDAVIAYGALENADLFFAVDQGLIGVFMPGEGRAAANAREVKLYVEDPRPLRNDLTVNRAWIGAGGHVWAVAVVDNFLIPLRINTAASTTGWFRAPSKLSQFVIGDVDVGPIRPLSRPTLDLGNDVLLRSRTLISVRNATMHLAPMPIRPPTRGDSVSASIDDVGRICVDVSSAWQERRVVAVIDALDETGVSAIGGFVIAHIDVGADGARACTRPLGVDKAQHKLSLLRFNVVDRAVDRVSCPTAPCMVTTGADAM